MVRAKNYSCCHYTSLPWQTKGNIVLVVAKFTLDVIEIGFYTKLGNIKVPKQFIICYFIQKNTSSEFILSCRMNTVYQTYCNRCGAPGASALGCLTLLT